MQEDSRKMLYWAIPVVVFLGTVAALYFARRQQEPAPVEPKTVAPASTVPAIRHPVPEDAEGQDVPLPELNSSDAALREAIEGVAGRSGREFLNPQDIVRHVVVTVDNLPRKKTAVQLWPAKPTPGQLVTRGSDEVTLAGENAARYAPIIKLVQNADTKQLANTYFHFYPLFQQAYVDLGYPDGYFNDRRVEVIDHLLETPDVQGPIKLVQPTVHYEFADPELEARSAGQKTLIRMGNENAAVVKEKLRELRAELVKQQR